MSLAIKKKFSLPKRFQGSEKSVWVEYAILASFSKPLNLAQGYADFLPPEYITEALRQVALSNDPLIHQSTESNGHPRLLQALSTLYSKLLNRDIDPSTELLVTIGAYGALYSPILGNINKGDEVIIIEPFFDCYKPLVEAAEGVPRFISLKPIHTSSKKLIHSNDWKLDPKEFEELFNEKTKMIILNTPHNPLGKVFDMDELEMIANLCKKWNVICVSDEVYEWLVYKPNKHIRIASLPGMWERTITIGSGGKTFCITGYRIGWAYGSAELMFNLKMVHQYIVSSCSTPIQEAIAIGFEKELARLESEECYFVSLANELKQKRDYMVQFLLEVGLKSTIPDGGFFLVADWKSLENQIDLKSETDQYNDYRFTKWMSKNVKIHGIPPSAFFSEPHKFIGENYIRFTFIKKNETLKKAHDILQAWKHSHSQKNGKFLNI